MYNMKRNITISIDEDVFTKLQLEKHKSTLINSYLRHYFELNAKSEEETEEVFKEAGLL